MKDGRFLLLFYLSSPPPCLARLWMLKLHQEGMNESAVGSEGGPNESER